MPASSVTNSYNLNFGGTILSALFAAAAAIVLIVIMRIVSAGPVGHPITPDWPDRAAQDSAAD